MGDIDIFVPSTVPTICGPVSDFQKLTLTENAYTLGWLGYGAGVLTSVLFLVGVFVVGPRLYTHGKVKGWW